MTADTGYMKAWFGGSDDTMAAFRSIVDHTDRQNLFSCGLSWLDDLDNEFEVESESVSYDSISATQEFLSQLLTQLPNLHFEGTLEHSWPTLPCKQTFVSFSSENGHLLWNERLEDASEAYFDDADFDGFEPDEDEILIPLTPYD